MKLDIDIRVPVGAPLPELVDFFGTVADAGFHGIGIHDHHHSGRDAYVALALAAHTTDLHLFPATTNTVTRHLTVLAALANSLTELAPGRFLLSVAPGFLSVERAGKPQGTRAQLREAIVALKALLRGDSVGYQGATLQQNNVVSDPPEIYLLAAGPKMLELAGEVADGVMIYAGFTAASVEAARDRVRAGATRAGRDYSDLGEILIVTTEIGPREQAIDWVRTDFRPGKPFLAYPSAANLRWLATAGIDLAPDHDPRAISDADAGRIADAYGIFGPAGYMVDRLEQAREEFGARRLFFFPAHSATTGYDLPAQQVAEFGRSVAPRLS